MRTKFFCTNFLNTARGPGHPGKIPGTSRIPLFETQGRQSFEGGHEVFGHHPFAWKTPTPPGGLRTQKLNLCALFSCLKECQWKSPTQILWGHRQYQKIKQLTEESEFLTPMRRDWSRNNCWAIPPVRLGLSGRNSRKIPERPRKRSQSVSWNFPREYGWDAPNPIIQGIEASRAFPEFSPPPVRLGTPLFSELVPERASQESCSWNSQQYWGYFWIAGSWMPGKLSIEKLTPWAPKPQFLKLMVLKIGRQL